MSKNASWPRASRASRASRLACGNCSRRFVRSSTSQRIDAVSESRRAVTWEAQAMNRRVFVTGLGAVLAAPLTVEAQQAGRVWRIGQLVTSSGSALGLDTFRQRLGERGYFEGQNLLIEYRNAEGRPERLPALATELVRLRVDVIVTVGTEAAFAAKQATTVIPIVMGTSGDAVGAGLVQSLARPGGNVTGITGRSP